LSGIEAKEGSSFLLSGKTSESDAFLSEQEGMDRN
jgi:hypothetical protein